MNNLLHGIRVIDLTDELGAYTTKLLADLGADVIRIAPPGQDPTERPPYLKADVSLYSLFVNQNKRRVALDILQPGERELFERLCGVSQVVVWSSLDGIRDPRWPLVERLRGTRGRILTLISPFGLEGPYCQSASSDLVNMALGGFLSLSGYPDYPVTPFGEQSLYAVSLHAAMGTLAALYHWKRTGEGQEVEVAAQAAVAHALENAIQYVDLEGRTRQRIGTADPEAGTGVFQCLDGYVVLMSSLQGSLLRWEEVVEWVGEEDFRRSRWTDLAWRQTDEARQLFRTLFERFAAGQSKAELVANGQKRGVNICPLSTPTDIAVNPQLHARRFFQRAESAVAAQALTFIGPPFRVGEVVVAHRTAAPGGDTAQVLADLGLTGGDGM